MKTILNTAKIELKACADRLKSPDLNTRKMVLNERAESLICNFMLEKMDKKITKEQFDSLKDELEKFCISLY